MKIGKEKSSFFFIVLFVSLVGISVFDEEKMVLNKNIRQAINSLMPQGWGFFTKDPREFQYIFYEISDKEIIKKVTIKNNSFENSFGLSRKSRRIGMEQSIITSQIKDSLWTKHRNFEILQIPSENRVIIENKKMINYIKKGDYVIIRKEIVPWAWINEVSKDKEYYEITRIKI
jgi:antimicrobial peptide system SdpA family protein